MFDKVSTNVKIMIVEIPRAQILKKGSKVVNPGYVVSKPLVKVNLSDFQAFEESSCHLLLRCRRSDFSFSA